MINPAEVPALEVAHFSKSYESVQAVDDLSFAVQPGEILGLVGPNGAGKTTTLRAVAGMLAPTKGIVRIGGNDIAQQSVEAKRQLAFLPDEPKLFEYLTIKEHLNFIARLYGVKDWEAKSETLLAELELSGKENVLPGELSRGMKQKTVIACAFLHDPKLIVLDEPLTGLDPIGIRHMKKSLVRRAESGSALVLSSHLLPLVEEVCHRVLVLVKGKAVAIGTVEEIKNKFVSGGSLEDVFIHIATNEQGLLAEVSKTP